METWPQPKLEPLEGYDMCFGCGETNPIGLKLKFSWDGATARAEFTAGKNHQGWSGYIHGGITACVLDEAMGWVAMYAGYNNVTAKMQTRYRKMAPINEPLIVSCTITKKTTRLIETEARLTLKDGTILAEATSTQFIISPREEKQENMKKTEIRAVLWDMDGVIADTSSQHFESWQFAFKKREIKFTAEDFKHHFGQRNDIIIRDAAGRNIPENEIEVIAKRKGGLFPRVRQGPYYSFSGCD